MILHAYLDDSYDNDWYVVGGFLAPKSVWEIFGARWYSALKEKPRLGFYRTSDALALAGQFQHFDREQRDDRIVRLSEVLPLKNFFGISAHLSRNDFEEFFTPNFLPVYGDPYYICALYLIENTCLAMKVSRPNPKIVDFIFDRQGKVGDKFRTVFDRGIKPLSTSLFPFIGQCRHEDKEKVLPLQAADMHVSWRRRILRGIVADNATPADQRMVQIDNKEYRVTRDFLHRTATFQKEHGEEIRAMQRERFDE